MENYSTEIAELDPKAVCRALTAELPEPLRRLRVEVLADSLAHGVPVAPLAATVVLSAIDEQVTDPADLQAEDVEMLLWHGIGDFCAEHGLDMPEQAGAAVHAVLATAVRLGFFSPAASCPRQLFQPLQQMGLAPSGRRGRPSVAS